MPEAVPVRRQDLLGLTDLVEADSPEPSQGKKSPRTKPAPQKSPPPGKRPIGRPTKNRQQTSVLMRLDKDPLALLRQSYIAICDGSHCAAMVLADLEYH